MPSLAPANPANAEATVWFAGKVKFGAPLEVRSLSGRLLADDAGLLDGLPEKPSAPLWRKTVWG